MSKILKNTSPINLSKFFNKENNDCDEESENESDSVQDASDGESKRVEYTTKCGEISFDEKHLVIFSCCFCLKGFKHLENLFRHLARWHLSLVGDDSMLSEGTNDEIGDDPGGGYDACFNTPKEEIVKVNENLRSDSNVICEEEERNESKVLKRENKYFEELKILNSADESNELETFEFVDRSFHVSTVNCSQPTIEPKLTSSRSLTENIPYICEFCGKAFKYKQLKRHLQLHYGNKAYKCNICGHAFADPTNLVTHKRRHLGIKPHSCDICGKSFVSPTECKTHMMSHTDDRPHVCNECGKSFIRKTYLVHHQQIHRNERQFACSKCDKRFNTKKNLRNHQTCHSEERRIKCPVCDAAFKSRRHLRPHMDLHSGEKKFVCKVCSKAFAQYPGLCSHMKTHRKDNC